MLGAHRNFAAGGSAAAAGSLVETLGGRLLGYVFLLELDFLHGRDKLNAPVYTLLSSQPSWAGQNLSGRNDIHGVALQDGKNAQERAR
jgi:hypothetical protein